MTLTQRLTKQPQTRHRLAAATVALALAGACSRSTEIPQPMIAPGTKLPALQAEGWLYGEPPIWPTDEPQWTVLVCWAYWCSPCHQRAPTWVELAKRYEAQNVRFYGLTAESSASLDETRRESTLLEMHWPLGYGASKTMQALGVTSIPAEILVGPDGTVQWTSDASSPSKPRAENLEQAIEFAITP